MFFQLRRETPSSSDWYLMQIADEVHHVLRKRKPSHKLSRWRLKFEQLKKRAPTKEEVSENSRRAWLSALPNIEVRKGKKQ